MEKIISVTPPADVPASAQSDYTKNYLAITQNSGRLALFACDQKIEHLNKDFYGEGIHPDAMAPQHLFAIASKGKVGAMAAHLGLIARYGKLYSDVQYIVKLNGKTDLLAPTMHDPLSAQLWSVADVMQFKKSSGLHVAGVGYTLYLGSEHEAQMLAHAAQIIFQAHQQGLIAVLWVYPRGKAVADDQDADVVAGAAGIAAALGADFVKIKPPHHVTALRIATLAAGNTQLICSGGSLKEVAQLIQDIHDQIHVGGAAGSATGRNIFQRSLREAIALTQAIQAVVVDLQDVAAALKIYEETKNA